MKLGEYMEANKLTPEAMASLIGTCTASAVKKWLYGERDRPRAETMLRIQEVTEGQVSLADWFAAESNTHSGAAA